VKFAQNPTLANSSPSGALEAASKGYADGLIAALTPAGLGAHKALTVTSTKTGNYTAASGDVVPCNSSGGGFTITLPTAAVGSVIVVTKTGTDNNKISIAKQGGDAWLNGTPVDLVTQGDVRWFYGYNGGWVQVDPPGSKLKQFPVVTLTYAATVAPDCNVSNSFLVVATGNMQLLAPTGTPVDGQILELEFNASGGARTLSLATAASAGQFKFGTDITALSATGSGLNDILQTRWSANKSRWLVTGYVKGF